MHQTQRWLGGVIACVVIQAAMGAKAQEVAKYLSLPESQIPALSAEGRRMLLESKHQESFWQLVQFFDVQEDLGSCGVASATIVLNALPVERPRSRRHGEFRLFTGDNLFEGIAGNELSRSDVSRSGMTLRQLGSLLERHQAEVELRYASASSLHEFRECLTQTLDKQDRFVVVNYLRSAVGQQSGGHISPLGAYSAAADKVLVLDTASYKYPWVWIDADLLWEAMLGNDSESQLSRGYAIVGAWKG